MLSDYFAVECCGNPWADSPGELPGRKLVLESRIPYKWFTT